MGGGHYDTYISRCTTIQATFQNIAMRGSVAALFGSLHLAELDIVLGHGKLPHNIKRACVVNHSGVYKYIGSLIDILGSGVITRSPRSLRTFPPSLIKGRAAARARGKTWYAAVNVAAKRLAEAEAAGLRAPMSDLHRRTAERLLDLCRKNGGVYVKLGQHLSQLDFILPNEFIEVLNCMLDQVREVAAGQLLWRANTMVFLLTLVLIRVII